MSEKADVVLVVSPEGVRRGGRVDVRIELAEGTDSGEPVEVALVCNVRYDVYGFATTASGERTRSNQKAVAWREQQAVAPSQRIAGLSFEVPANAPYSYRGRALSFDWEVTARQPIPRRRDKQAAAAVRVLP